jgi:hypothetical protein
VPWPAHNHVEFGGRRGDSTSEIWQCGVRVAKPENDGETVPWGHEPFDGIDTEGYVVDVAAHAVRYWFTHPDSHISPYCRLDWVSSTWITPSGNPDPRYSYRHEYADPAAGGGFPTPVLPFQCALVISWGATVRTRGPGSRGRIFSPAPAISIDGTTGLITAGQALRVAESARYLIYWLAFGNLPTGDKRYPSIVSPSGPGYRSRVETITVDTRVDVLRKRGEWQHPERAVHEVDWGPFDE